MVGCKVWEIMTSWIGSGGGSCGERDGYILSRGGQSLKNQHYCCSMVGIMS